MVQRTKHSLVSILICCAAIAVASCEEGGRRDSSGRAAATDTMVNDVAFRVADSAGIRIVETLEPRMVESRNRWVVADEPEIRVGSADDGLTWLGHVSGIAGGPNGEIIVADAQTFQIKAYSAVGEPIWSEGREGDGPGEYRGIRTVEHCGGHILVADLQARRFTMLSDSSSVIGTTAWLPLRPGAAPFRFACNNSGALVQLDRESNPPPREGRYTVSAVIGVGQLGADRPEMILEIPGIDRYRHGTVDGPADFGKTTWVVASEEGVIVIVSDRTEFRTYDYQGHLRGIARWASTPRPITSSVLNAEVAERERVLPHSRRAAYRELWLSLDHPDYLPAIDTVVAAADGGFWARRFQPASERRDFVAWWRVDRDGVLRGIVEVPSGFELFRVVPGAVLGLVRDSLNVESVERRAIRGEVPWQ